MFETQSTLSHRVFTFIMPWKIGFNYSPRWRLDIPVSFALLWTCCCSRYSSGWHENTFLLSLANTKAEEKDEEVEAFFSVFIINYTMLCDYIFRFFHRSIFMRTSTSAMNSEQTRLVLLHELERESRRKRFIYLRDNRVNKQLPLLANSQMIKVETFWHNPIQFYNSIEKLSSNAIKLSCQVPPTCNE